MLRRSLLALLLFPACRAAEDPSPPTRIVLADQAYDPRPLVPAILRDVAMIDDEVAFTHPYVPGHRTTMDGRVGLRVQGGTNDIDRLSTHLSFFLFAPEKLQEPIITGPAGPEILSSSSPFDVEFLPALDGDVFRLGHHAVCDPTEEFAVEGERTNPYPCGEEGLSDCYDITVISSTSPGLSAQLWGTPATIMVAEPKTASARIVDVTLGESVMGVEIPSSTEWTEPAVTMDGRLMTGRLGRLPRVWTNPETGETLTRPYDLAYSLLPEGADPCDVTGWTEFHPMSHAPFDPAMQRYGLAQYPFRDSEGNPIPDGEDLGGTYPWVDREGANLFMTAVPGRLSEQSEVRYPRRCVHEGCDDYPENIDFDRGFMVAGLWTHGKLVHLDGLINNVYWSVGVTPETHWEVDLYADEAGDPVGVRVGSGRFIGRFREDGPYPGGYTHNANILDSLQNLPNMHSRARPVTPRDVVWVMSSGVATDEIAFDDLLDPRALIVSNMQASITQHWGEDGSSTGVPIHHSGEVRTLGGLPGVLATWELSPEEDAEVHVQNAATSLAWQVPAYGRMEAGSGRTEPVALGGVEGRGLWLSGDAAVTYAMPAQGADAVAAYLGLFVDPRTPDGEARELLRFPDETGVVLSGSSRLTYVLGDRVIHEVDLPSSDGWVHLGWHLDAGHRRATLLHDGFALDTFDSPEPVFSIDGGDLVLGRSTGAWTGFRGWVDNLVLFAHEVDPEVACNHAKGTLVALGPDAELERIASRYPSWAHAEVAEAAGRAEGRFLCWQDHSDDYAAHLANRPTGTEPLRDAILVPEGHATAGSPRPDSSDNAFCLTCHTSESRGGLGLAALAPDAAVDAEHDRRRQPHQPPRRVFGNVPAGWLPGGPDHHVQAPPEGLLVDAWLMSE